MQRARALVRSRVGLSRDVSESHVEPLIAVFVAAPRTRSPRGPLIALRVRMHVCRVRGRWTPARQNVAIESG